MLVHERVAIKRQESHTECEGIRDYISYSEQFDWKTDFGKTGPWWVCSGTSTGQGGSGRKGVALQEEEEITAMIVGPRKDKQYCNGTLRRKRHKTRRVIIKNLLKNHGSAEKYHIWQRKF